jgi:hypothetical protein
MAPQDLESNNEILQDLVQGMPHVDIAVGVWRAIVKDVNGTFRSLGKDLSVKAHPLPCGQDLRLSLREIPLHGESRLG